MSLLCSKCHLSSISPRIKETVFTVLILFTLAHAYVATFSTIKHINPSGSLDCLECFSSTYLHRSHTHSLTCFMPQLCVTLTKRTPKNSKQFLTPYQQTHLRVHTHAHIPISLNVFFFSITFINYPLFLAS